MVAPLAAAATAATTGGAPLSWPLEPCVDVAINSASTRGRRKASPVLNAAACPGQMRRAAALRKYPEALRGEGTGGRGPPGRQAARPANPPTHERHRAADGVRSTRERWCATTARPESHATLARPAVAAQMRAARESGTAVAGAAPDARRRMDATSAAAAASAPAPVDAPDSAAKLRGQGANGSVHVPGAPGPACPLPLAAPHVERRRERQEHRACQGKQVRAAAQVEGLVATRHVQRRQRRGREGVAGGGGGGG